MTLIGAIHHQMMIHRGLEDLSTRREQGNKILFRMSQRGEIMDLEEKEAKSFAQVTMMKLRPYFVHHLAGSDAFIGLSITRMISVLDILITGVLGILDMNQKRKLMPHNQI